MCGIWVLLLKEGGKLEGCYDAFGKISPRGPDRSYFVEHHEPYGVKFGFHRLSIMDPSVKGDQPFVYMYTDLLGKEHMIHVLCNGEIYKFRELAEKYSLKLTSGSDCEVIHLLFLKIGIDGLMKELVREEFAFVLTDIEIGSKKVVVYAARDPFGVRPLFVVDLPEYIQFCSEIKGLVSVSKREMGGSVRAFRPGHYMVVERDEKGVWNEPRYVQYYSCRNVFREKSEERIEQTLSGEEIFLGIKKTIVRKLTDAVSRRLIADRPLGCFLSGGLDSSLVASITARILRKSGKRLRTFSIGMPGSTDEKYAKMVAKYIDSDHTHVLVTSSEWLAAISEIIHTTETYDITTIRASAGQLLLSKWISKNTDIKVVLIGDGSDELFSGYLYFHKSPNPIASHKENMRLLEDISYFDVLRADRGIAASGLEARVPFLDTDLVDYILSLDPKLRIPIDSIEKWLLRKSFEDLDYLPSEVLYRKKEAFSDGVSSLEKSWYVILQENIEKIYTDTQFTEKQKTYTHNVPPSKEALYYREIFETHFGKGLDHIIPYYWLPKWCGDISEPSARVLKHY
ncbi:MAG: asparagine synthase (glutamine-hydrolysing) [Hyperionvirus sp.]|uniref:asparagine synthase (glutamine-hydrolyzing) n=1 Tax=Hyperionvirus sp. TaxID=2487770 RepID=A0A3G5ACE5_9VIRU|nr:MAG: asparagine synthase (glutamine-hydrolysing) [Hyperionvirus sp.]